MDKDEKILELKNITKEELIEYIQDAQKVVLTYWRVGDYMKMNYEEIEKYLDGMTEDEFNKLIEDNKAGEICDIIYNNVLSPINIDYKTPGKFNLENFIEDIDKSLRKHEGQLIKKPKKDTQTQLNLFWALNCC